jgi:Prp8 binding protein
MSPSLSSQTIIHDIRPFSPSPTRIHRTLVGTSCFLCLSSKKKLTLVIGAPAGFENALLRGAWSRTDNGGRVAVGGADRTVTVWDVETTKIQYKLPGHKGTVTCVDFHPKEPISK